MIRLINSLGAMKDLPISVAWKDVPLAWNVPNERLGGDGAVPVGPKTLEPRSFELRGSIYHYDKAQIRAYHDDLLAFLRHVPLQVYQYHQDDRFMWATPTGNPQQWIDGRVELQMQVQMVAHDSIKGIFANVLDSLPEGAREQVQKAIDFITALIKTVEGSLDTLGLVQQGIDEKLNQMKDALDTKAIDMAKLWEDTPQVDARCRPGCRLCRTTVPWAHHATQAHVPCRLARLAADRIALPDLPASQQAGYLL